MAYGIQTLDVLDMIVHDQVEFVWYSSRGGAPLPGPETRDIEIFSLSLSAGRQWLILSKKQQHEAGSRIWVEVQLNTLFSIRRIVAYLR